MSDKRPITIVGGGLAGLALGIGLRRLDIAVTIIEAGHYPRQRVCGEFVSGRGQLALLRLGLHSIVAEAGAVSARTVAFFSSRKSSPARNLPEPAVCLSRWEMDARLAAAFRALGGELQEGVRWAAERGGEGVVRATGRRLTQNGGEPRWFGLKAHARNVPLAADLEMHVSALGYVGLCRVENGEVNICGLFHRRSLPAGREHVPASDPANTPIALPSPSGVMTGLPHPLLLGQPGSPLHERLAGADFVGNSFCSVAGLSLRPVLAAQRSEVCIGDALTMIPPVTGNGMSMAFESAELAIEPLLAWSGGTESWEGARKEIARRCDERFARRLVWAKWLQRLILTTPLQDSLVSLASRSDWFWRLGFGKTR